jgi:hypothetical protein
MANFIREDSFVFLTQNGKEFAVFVQSEEIEKIENEGPSALENK